MYIYNIISTYHGAKNSTRMMSALLMVSSKLSLVRVRTAGGGGAQLGSARSFMYATMPVDTKTNTKICHKIPVVEWQNIQ